MLVKKPEYMQGQQGDPHIVDMIKRELPHVFDRWAMPRYESPAGYRSYKLLQEAAAINDLSVSLDAMDWSERSVETLMFMLLAQYDYPLCYVTEGMCDAALATRVPEWVTADEIAWPLPVMCFMFPQGQYFAPDGGEIVGMSVGRWAPKDTYLLATLLDKGEVRLQQPVINMIKKLVAHGTDNYMASVFVLDKGVPFVRSVTISTPAAQSIQRESDQILTGDESWNLPDEKTPDFEDPRWKQLMLATPANLMMLFGERDDLLQKRSISRNVKSKKGGGREPMWRPWFLGKGYEAKQEISESLGGTHASPRAHWRIGHWRQQPHGPQHSLRKIIWIEPIRVNPST